jgi:serine/threonine protein kinase
MCEASDEAYDTRADIWSLGVTLIELAQMEPPHRFAPALLSFICVCSEISPMRVGIGIIKSDPPRLVHTSRWSREFHAFLARCLQKSPTGRPPAKALLDDVFVRDATDARPLLTLLREARAQVIEEVVDEECAADVSLWCF